MNLLHVKNLSVYELRLIADMRGVKVKKNIEKRWII